MSDECCGFPEIGVCPDCPDPETVEWGKRNPPRWVKTEGGAVLTLCGSHDEQHLAVIAELAENIK